MLTDDNGEIIPVRWSWLGRMVTSSPEHARHQALHGMDPTPAMKLGTAGHAAAFEPHRLKVYRPGVFVDKKGKTRNHSDRKDGEAYEQFVALQPRGSIIVTQREFNKAQAIASALRRHDAARTTIDGKPMPLLFAPGVVHEQRIAWLRPYAGADPRVCRVCTSIPDARIPGKAIVDLKVCRDARPDAFVRSALRMGYFGQLQFYREADAFECGIAEPVSDAYIVAVESTPPHSCVTYRMTEQTMIGAAKMVADCWSRLEYAERVNHWPGYVQAVSEIDINDDEFSAFGPDEMEPIDTTTTADVSDDGNDWEF